MSSLIELINVHKMYVTAEISTPVLHDINIKINHNELLAIMGASGSGKSTLMNILGLLDKQTTGTYLLDNEDTSNLSISQLAHIRNRKIGFIFQSFFLLPMLTIVQNVILPLTYKGDMGEESMLESGYAILEKVGLAHLATRYPNQLSGGQQQRIAIARALINRPSVILADEPTGALDSKTGKEIMELFIHLNQQEHNTVIMITHAAEIAYQCERVIHLQDGIIINEEYK